MRGFGIRRSLAPYRKAGADRVPRAAINTISARWMVAALGIGIGLGASSRGDAGPIAADSGNVAPTGCPDRPGPIGSAAAIPFEPVAPAENGDMACAAGRVPPHDHAILSRTQPVPAPVPNMASGDDDANPLEVGLNIGRARGHGDGMHVGVVVLNGQFGFIHDRIGNGRRARLQFGFQPVPHVDLGLCATDGFSDISGTGLRGRCLATIESEVSYVFARGQAYFLSRGEIGGVGGKVEYDLAKPINDGAALVASMSYRRVPTMIGRAPDIRRWESAIKYRFYVAAVMGVDLGVTLGKGTEPKSLMQENRVQAGLGLTF